MRSSSDPKIFFVGIFLSALFSLFPASAICQSYPNKPITLYVGYVAGGATDVLARALAADFEKALGVPVVVENKPGALTVVCTGLLATKKPDGYTLAMVTDGALTMAPHMAMKLDYDPLKDFTYLAAISRYIGTMVVHKDSPIKNIHEFITYAKANPGLSYSSTGLYGRHHLATERFAQCKGLTFKHIPTKGAAEANTMQLGKHVDFSTGSGGQIVYVKQGLFRLLMLLNEGEKRNPLWPDTPILHDLGCPDVPASAVMMIGPKGVPPAICKKLGDVVKKITGEPSFQKVLASFDMLYNYRDQAKLEKDIPAEYELSRELLKKMGVKKTAYQ